MEKDNGPTKHVSKFAWYLIEWADNVNALFIQLLSLVKFISLLRAVLGQGDVEHSQRPCLGSYIYTVEILPEEKEIMCKLSDCASLRN